MLKYANMKSQSENPEERLNKKINHLLDNLVSYKSGNLFFL